MPSDTGTTLVSWSSTSASNGPSGSTSISTNLDDSLREIQGVVVRGLSHKGADIASAGTTDIGAVEGLLHDITGSTTITSFGTVRAGIWKILKFEGALTLTHNATSLILPGGANITTADGDVGVFFSEGSGNWRCVSFFKAASGAIIGLATLAEAKAGTDTVRAITPSTLQNGKPVLGTAVASTSGTSIDFTSIPSWVKRITVGLDGVSTNGSSNPLIQIGDSGGIEATGYAGASSVMTNAAASTNYTTGFGIALGNAANVFQGAVTLTLIDASTNTWVASGIVATSNQAATATVAGSKSLSATLDRVRITTVNGTDTFDAGSINIQYE